jgi:hypothetical protein
MKIEEKHLAHCGLYCGVCGVYYATRDNNDKFLNKLLAMYQEKSRVLVTSPSKISNVKVVCLTESACSAGLVPSGPVPGRRATAVVMNVMISPVTTSKTFPCPWGKKLSCALYPTGGSTALKNGPATKKPDISARNAGRSYLEVRNAVMHAKLPSI